MLDVLWICCRSRAEQLQASSGSHLPGAAGASDGPVRCGSGSSTPSDLLPVQLQTRAGGDAFGGHKDR